MWTRAGEMRGGKATDVEEDVVDVEEADEEDGEEVMVEVEEEARAVARALAVAGRSQPGAAACSNQFGIGEKGGVGGSGGPAGGCGGSRGTGGVGGEGGGAGGNGTGGSDGGRKAANTSSSAMERRVAAAPVCLIVT